MAEPVRHRTHFLLSMLPTIGLLGLAMGQFDIGPREANPPERVDALRTRLETGEGSVRIIVFGDSLTDGWGPEDGKTEGFVPVFARAIRAQYPDCEIEVIAAGGPGDTSEVGLIRVGREVVRREPDLVVLQFGGNDQGFGRKPADLETDLGELIETVTDPPTSAVCIVAANPFNDPAPGSTFVAATHRAAKRFGVPVADFDQALHDADRDHRGPFAWESHPAARGHLLMARELLRTWDELFGTEAKIEVEIEGRSELIGEGDALSYRTLVRNAGGDALGIDVEYGPAPIAKGERVNLSPDEQGEFTDTITLPALTPATRTRRVKLWTVARSVEAHAAAIDGKTMSIAPVLVPEVVRDLARPNGLTWYRLTHESIQKGAYTWGGEVDLGARFALMQRENRLEIVVEVTDDDIDPAPGGTWVGDHDSVEICLDLRPASEQGKPGHTKDVMLLLFSASTDDGRPTNWQPLDGLSPRLVGVSARGGKLDGGYRLTISIPMRVLQREGEKDYTGIGFDVHVNDSDFGHGRDCLMVFAGTGDNYLDASGLAALAAPADETPRWRVSVR